MKRYGTIATLVLVGLLVMAIGGLAGWYVVLRVKGQNISFADAARGFGFGTPSASQNGSTYNNIGIGGGTGGQNGGSFSAGGGSGVGGTGGGIAGTDSSAVANANGAGENSPSASSSLSLAYGSSTLPTVVIPKTPRLWNVTKTPIAGFNFATSAPVVFFSERATGYMFTADAISGDVLRRTNTLLPKTYEALVSRDGAAIYRSVNETTGAVQTFSGVICSTTSSNLGAFVGVNLRNNILAMDANSDAKTIFFIISDSGTFSGFTEPWTAGKSGKEKQVFTSSVASWRPIVLSDGRLVVVEKAEDNAEGYAYEIAPDATMKPLVRAAPGLTVLPLANSSAFLFGTSQNGTLALFAQTSTSTFSVPVNTVADKCVWVPFVPASKKNPASHLVAYCAVPQNASEQNFLENWYMGALHTSDSWWRIDITSGDATQVFEASSGGSLLDVVDPAIDPTGNFLGFKNGTDGSLWVLRINK